MTKLGWWSVPRSTGHRSARSAARSVTLARVAQPPRPALLQGYRFRGHLGPSDMCRVGQSPALGSLGGSVLAVGSQTSGQALLGARTLRLCRARVRAVLGGNNDGPYETLADLTLRRQRRAKRPLSESPRACAAR